MYRLERALSEPTNIVCMTHRELVYPTGELFINSMQLLLNYSVGDRKFAL